MNFNKTQQQSSSLIDTVDTFEVLIVSISIRDEEKISTESELNLRESQTPYTADSIARRSERSC